MAHVGGRECREWPTLLSFLKKLFIIGHGAHFLPSRSARFIHELSCAFILTKWSAASNSGLAFSLALERVIQRKVNGRTSLNEMEVSCSSKR